MHRAAPVKQGKGAYRKIRRSQRTIGAPGKGADSNFTLFSSPVFFPEHICLLFSPPSFV